MNVMFAGWSVDEKMGAGCDEFEIAGAIELYKNT